jgi:hypothetical protein
VHNLIRSDGRSGFKWGSVSIIILLGPNLDFAAPLKTGRMFFGVFIHPVDWMMWKDLFGVVF